MTHKAIYVLWPLSVIIAVFLGSASQPTLEVNQDQAEWLPDGATNGCRYNGKSFILGPPAYYREYSISEARFLVAFEDEKGGLQEVDEPLWVPRYYERVLCKSDLPGGADVTEDYEEFRRATHAVITNGLVYSWEFEDQMTIVAYDRESERAYCYNQTR